MMATAVDEALNETFFALSDPTRRSILARLATDDATVNDLAAPFSMTVQAVSKHLKVLERAQLVSRGRTAQFRPVRLEVVALDDAAGWIADSRKVWADRLDRLDAHLADLQTRGRTRR